MAINALEFLIETIYTNSHFLKRSILCSARDGAAAAADNIARSLAAVVLSPIQLHSRGTCGHWWWREGGVPGEPPIKSPLILQSSPLGGAHNRNASCVEGYYFSTETSDCQECSPCSKGEGTLQPCTSISNTICARCDARGMVSTLNAATGSWDCQNCTNCTKAHRLERRACSGTANSICGTCFKGYFLGVDSNRVVLCMRCSQCPPEDGRRRVTRWRDCKEAGLERDMWCSPGIVDEIYFPCCITDCCK